MYSFLIGLLSFLLFLLYSSYFLFLLCPSVLHILSLFYYSDFFPLTTSDYTQPPLAITFSSKSTQPLNLPHFRFLFGSTVVIKMLSGSSSLLSIVSFLSHHAMAIQHFLPAFPSPLPTLSPPLPIVSSTLSFCLALLILCFVCSVTSVFLRVHHPLAVLSTAILTFQGIYNAQFVSR